MLIKHIVNAQYIDDNFATPFISINRPFKCTCCCLERPEMFAQFTRDKQPLGKIKQKFTCCDPEFITYDNCGIEKYFISADCCQCGLCCKNTICGKCSQVLFNVYPAKDPSSPCGSILKKPANFSELITSADSYQVNFPADPSP